MKGIAADTDNGSIDDEDHGFGVGDGSDGSDSHVNGSESCQSDSHYRSV